MKAVHSCANCSNMIITRTAGFIQDETCTCAIFSCEVESDDGCTFGDDLGVIPYDIDMSMVPAYQNAYDEW